MLSAIVLLHLIQPTSSRFGAAHLEPTPFELQSLDISRITQGWGEPHANLSVEGNPLKIAGTTYPNGIGTHAISEGSFRIDGNASSFSALVGVDDETQGKGSVTFKVFADGKLAGSSPVMRSGTPAFEIKADLKGAKVLKLYVDDAGDGIDYDHADWIAPTVALVHPSPRPKLDLPVEEGAYPIAPVDRVHTRINGPKILGCTPGHEFVFHVPVSGQRPVSLIVDGLPEGLRLDSGRGVITGSVAHEGEYTVRIRASGPGGTDVRQIKIVAGAGKLALTPPMGWNSWNVWAGEVDWRRVKAAADAFIGTGLADFGYSYVNIDDTWEAGRDEQGEIQSNAKFPDMLSLSGYIHGLGLRMGIYSSPGPTTCAGFTASYEHEDQDAKTYAKWGMDYLKYDWCSYGDIAPHPDLDALQKPYRVMHKALEESGRDIVFSLCQYGMGDVYKWGAEVGGNLWRTTGDINDSWSSLSGIAFQHSVRSPYVKPGGWNDPDMLVVGRVGWGSPHPSHLTKNEQILHISMWSMLAAPLMIGCDLDRIDDFTQALLMNPEVIDIDQDSLGRAAVRIRRDGDIEVWARPLSDGSTAVALFNRGSGRAQAEFDSKDFVTPSAGVSHDAANADAVGYQFHVASGMKLRDLWRRASIGRFHGSFKQMVPSHGAVLIKIG